MIIHFIPGTYLHTVYSHQSEYDGPKAGAVPAYRAAHSQEVQTEAEHIEQHICNPGYHSYERDIGRGTHLYTPQELGYCTD